MKKKFSQAALTAIIMACSASFVSAAGGEDADKKGVPALTKLLDLIPQAQPGGGQPQQQQTPIGGGQPQARPAADPFANIFGSAPAAKPKPAQGGEEKYTGALDPRTNELANSKTLMTMLALQPIAALFDKMSANQRLDLKGFLTQVFTKLLNIKKPQNEDFKGKFLAVYNPGGVKGLSNEEKLISLLGDKAAGIKGDVTLFAEYSKLMHDAADPTPQVNPFTSVSAENIKKYKAMVLAYNGATKGS